MTESKAQQKGLWGLSKPLLMEQALQFSVPLIDTLFLSIISDSAAGAAGALTPVLFLCGNLLWVIVFAGASIANQRLGAGMQEKAVATIWIFAGWSLLLSIVLALILYWGIDSIIALMGLDGELAYFAGQYLHVAFALVMIWSAKAICQSILNMFGLPGWNLLANMIYFIANILGNTIVVFQLFGLPEYGITGVAWASVIASLSGVLISLFAIGYHVPLRSSWLSLKQNFRSVSHNLMRIGAPSTIEPISFDLNLLVLNSLAAKLGTLALTAKIYIFNTFMLGVIISVALTTATQILVTQKVGAGKLAQADQQLRRSLRASLWGTAVVAAILTAFHHPIISLYTQEQQLLAGAGWWFLLAALSEPGRTTNIMVGFNLRATGDGWYISVAGPLFTWLVALPMAYAMAFWLDWGLSGLLLGALLDECGRALLFWRRWQQQRWHHSHIQAREAARSEPHL